MKHPLITFVNVAQALLGFLLVMASGYWIFLALLARFDQAMPLRSEGTRGLLLGSAVPGIPGVMIVIAAYGLLKKRFWGWALSLTIDAVVLGLLIYIMFSARDLALTVLRISVSVMIVLLLLSPVRKFYLSATSSQKAETA